MVRKYELENCCCYIEQIKQNKLSLNASKIYTDKRFKNSEIFD